MANKNDHDEARICRRLQVAILNGSGLKASVITQLQALNNSAHHPSDVQAAIDFLNKVPGSLDSTIA